MIGAALGVWPRDTGLTAFKMPEERSLEEEARTFETRYVWVQPLVVGRLDTTQLQLTCGSLSLAEVG